MGLNRVNQGTMVCVLRSTGRDHVPPTFNEWAQWIYEQRPKYPTYDKKSDTGIH